MFCYIACVEFASYVICAHSTPCFVFDAQACENKAPSEVIKALVAAYPESLLMKDTAGDLPLHLACREKSSKAVLATLLSTEPTAAKVKDDEGKLPLHLACRQGVAVQIVDSLIVCHYRATRTPDSYNLLPLHWACAQNASVGIVESLLRANPDAIDHKDKWDRTPLSLATASTNPDKEGILAALKKDPGFWSNNLVDEIDHLKTKLKESDLSSSKVEQIQLENAMLKEKINDLTGKNKFSDDDIDKVAEENSVLGQEVDGLKKKLNEFVSIFRGMEDQRKTLVDLAERMESSIQQAVNTAGNEYMEWGDPLKSNGKKNSMSKVDPLRSNGKKNRMSKYEDAADESDFSD